MLSAWQEGSSQDVEILQGFPVDVLLFVDHPKAVLFLQTEKVDGPAVDVRQGYGQQRIGSAVLHGHPKGGFDLAATLLTHPFHGIFPACYRIVAPQIEDDVRFGVLLIDEKYGGSRAVRRDEKCIGLAGPDLAYIENPFGFLGQVVYIAGGKSVLLENHRQGLVALDDAVVYLIVVHRDAVLVNDLLYLCRIGNLHFVQRTSGWRNENNGQDECQCEQNEGEGGFFSTGHRFTRGLFR